MIKEVNLIARNNAENFSKVVNRHLVDGWEIHEGLKIGRIDGRYVILLVKHEPTSDWVKKIVGRELR